MRCQCLTLKNQQCKRDALLDSQFCKQHKDCQTKMNISKQKIAYKKKKSSQEKIPIGMKKEKSLSLKIRMKNFGLIHDIIFEKDNPLTFEDIGSDGGHTNFSQYLAGRGYTPEELLATKKKWNDDYETSKDSGVRKLNQLRKDFIKAGKPEWMDAFRAGLSHTWPELGLGQPLIEVAMMLIPTQEDDDENEEEWYNDEDIMWSLSKLPQYQ